MQKHFSMAINCLLCCMSWYSCGVHLQFSLCWYTFVSSVSYLHCCKILQPHVAATVRMHSDAVLSSFDALLMKTITKIVANNKWSTFASAGFVCRIHMNQPLQLCVERCASVSPICRYVLTIINVKILHKCDETSLTVIRITVSLTLK